MNKRVLLVTSAAPALSPFSTHEKRAPLGLGFLISVLRKEGHQVFFIDNYLQPSDFLERGFLQNNAIDYIGIYANTICYADTLRMFNKIQRLRESGKWKGKIIVGGPHTTVAADTIPDFVDHVVLGEGEQAIIDIVNETVSSRILRGERIKNLDHLPFPAWDFFVPLPYNFTAPWTDVTPVFTMNTSRGCPFGCTFCSVESIWGKKYTTYSAERIIEEVLFLQRNYSARVIYFREDNFTLKPKRVREFCQLLHKRHIDIQWICETRVDTLTLPLLREMKKSGCIGLYVGVESGSPRMLELMNKGISLQQVKHVFKWCRNLGIHTYASFIYGLPTETFEDLVQTQKLIHQIQPDRIGRGVFVAIPDSPLYRYVKENKLFDYKDHLGLLYLPGYNQRVDRYYGGNHYKIQHRSGDWIDYESEEAKMKERIIRRLRQRIKKWKRDKTTVVIYGAGLQTRTLFRRFDFNGAAITALVDRDENKIGKKILGLPVISPEQLKQIDFDEIFISLTVHTPEVSRFLKGKFISKTISSLYRRGEFFLVKD